MTAPYAFRNVANRLRKYEGLPHYPDGVAVIGDAVYAFNPVYGQGMTVAALSALALDGCLARQAGANALIRPQDSWLDFSRNSPKSSPDRGRWPPGRICVGPPWERRGR